MKRFADKKTSGAAMARRVMVIMFGLLTVFSAAGQEANKRIDTPDGLNMRDKPSISGTVLLTIPGGEIVSLIREEGNPVTIGDRTGKWSEVIWKNNRGWVFGGYLGAVAQEKRVALAIGDTHAGGVIFYLDGKGGGLVAAPSDQSTGRGIEWGGYGTTVGGILTEVGTGAANTKKIIQVLGGNAKAAKMCDDLTLNGYDDWFLPSKDELNLMYENLKNKGLGNFADGNYWSSSGYSEGGAWAQYFGDGTQGLNHKDYATRVRAVRAF